MRRFNVTIEAPDTCDGTIDIIGRMSLTCRQFADGTIEVTAQALDGSILGSLSVVAPAPPADRYEARPSPQSGSGFWYVLDLETGAEADASDAQVREALDTPDDDDTPDAFTERHARALAQWLTDNGE